MTERHAVAYVRRSVASRADPGDVSREFQTDAVRRLAALAGDVELVILAGDWGRSASTDKTAHRLAFLDLLGRVERGEVSNLYAYSADRLARSIEWSARLLNACRRAGTTIITNEGRFAPDDDGATDLFGFRAVINESVLRQMERKAKSAAERRAARGDAMGQPPYGQRIVRDATGAALRPIRWQDDPDRPLAPLLAAYAAAGSVLGACKALSAAGVPTPKGKVKPDGTPRWESTSLALILDRAGVLPPRHHRHLFAKSALFAGLIRCHCGHIMTPDHEHVRTGTSYYCHSGKLDGVAVHGRNWVREAVILPEIQAEAARLRVPFDAVAMGEDDANGRDSLAERKRRLGLAFAAGALDEPTFRAELAAIEATADRLEAAAEVVQLPPLDWTAPVATVNAVLRALFEYVQLAPDMTVAEIRWRVPEWRAEG
jgi:DNA invertase Pin-like site-specific DNA recombinase